MAIVPAGGSASAVLATVAVGPPGPADGRTTFSTTGLKPGAHDAVLLAAGGSVASRSPFWLYAPGTPTRVTTSKASYAVGEPIDVSWANAPGMRWDWLAVYAPGSSDSGPVARNCNAGCASNGRYLVYVYTRTAVEGRTRFDGASAPGSATWPLKAGTYEIRLLVDDSYRSVASSASFRIVKR